MAGLIVRAIPKRVFNYSTLIVGGGSTAQRTVLDRIDVSQYISHALVLRVHTATLTGGTITFSLWSDGFTEEDPSLNYNTLTQYSSITLDGSALQTTGGTILGQYAQIRVQANRTSANPLTATVSVDLVLRNADSIGVGHGTPMVGS